MQSHPEPIRSYLTPFCRSLCPFIYARMYSCKFVKSAECSIASLFGSWAGARTGKLQEPLTRNSTHLEASTQSRDSHVRQSPSLNFLLSDGGLIGDRLSHRSDSVYEVRIVYVQLGGKSLPAAQSDISQPIFPANLHGKFHLA